MSQLNNLSLLFFFLKGSGGEVADIGPSQSWLLKPLVYSIYSAIHESLRTLSSFGALVPLLEPHFTYHRDAFRRRRLVVGHIYAMAIFGSVYNKSLLKRKSESFTRGFCCTFTSTMWALLRRHVRLCGPLRLTQGRAIPVLVEA